MKSFPPAHAGGVRVEAHFADENPKPGSFLRAVRNGAKAVIWMGNSANSGIKATSVITKETADEFNGLLLGFARRHLKEDTGGLYVQASINQLGLHCLMHSRAREEFSSGRPWFKLFRTALAVAAAEESSRAREQHLLPLSPPDEELP